MNEKLKGPREIAPWALLVAKTFLTTGIDRLLFSFLDFGLKLSGGLDGIDPFADLRRKRQTLI